MLALMIETLGERLGRLRAIQGWTQQELADRIAVSRVAISHFEMDLAIPSERTVALLASVFKQEPASIVAGTYYPAGKAERLPSVVARYTEIEKELCLLQRDFDWLDRLDDQRLTFDTCQHWLDRLNALDAANLDKHERRLLEGGRARVQGLLRETSVPSS